MNKYGFIIWLFFQFRVQSTLTGVAQAVVDKIVRIHHDVHMSNSSSTVTNGKREDITLLVRNFNFPLTNALKSPTSPSVRFDPVVQTALVLNPAEQQDGYSTRSDITDESYDAFTATTSTTSDIYPPVANPVSRNTRIKPYVDFSEYYCNVEKRRQEGTLPEGIDF